MKTRAPEFSALISIRASVGPVISQRRSARSAGAVGTRQLVSIADRPGGRGEIELATGVELGLRAHPGFQQVAPGPAEFALQRGEKGERLRGQNLAGIDVRRGAQLVVRRWVTDGR